MAETERNAGAAGDWRDAVDQATRRISTALVIAAGILSVAIYARPAPPRFEAIAADGRLYRVDTRTGTVLACDGNRCSTVVKRGQRLERGISIDIDGDRGDAASKAAPAPVQPAAPLAPPPPSAPKQP